ncbi:MAG: hypothetical protein GWO08_19705, partial [Gammaproteobacteria bacterium]|nr:hypothetical protein [Gammaproteobacteria bacterium]
TANPTTLTAPGGSVLFTVVVSNNSNVPATLNSLNDSIYGDLFAQGFCTAPAQPLAVGANYSCS